MISAPPKVRITVALLKVGQNGHDFRDFRGPGMGLLFSHTVEYELELGTHRLCWPCLVWDAGSPHGF